jgi:HEAT repeat protein
MEADREGINVGRDEKVKEPYASLLPEKPRREFKSKSEQKVIELLESKHPVPPTKWTRLEPEEKEILKKLATDPEYPMRTKAITSLVLSDDRDHVRLLEEIISNRNVDNLVRSVAAISLGMSKNPEAGRVLLKFAGDEDEFLRAKVVEAIGKVGGEEEYYALKEAMTDKSPLVRSNAEGAIKLIDLRLGGLTKQKHGTSKSK